MSASPEGAALDRTKEVVRRFLRDFSGCEFARSLAQKANSPSNGLVWTAFASPAPEDLVTHLDAFLLAAIAENKAAVAVFPSLRTPEEIVLLLAALTAGERWSISRGTWKRHPRKDVLLCLRWQRAPGAPMSSVLGLAPLGSMPVHRRAPFVALSLWPGDKANPFYSKGRTISLAHMPPPQNIRTKAHHSNLWKRSEKASDGLRAIPPEGAADHAISFCLPANLDSVIQRDLGV